MPAFITRCATAVAVAAALLAAPAAAICPVDKEKLCKAVCLPVAAEVPRPTLHDSCLFGCGEVVDTGAYDASCKKVCSVRKELPHPTVKESCHVGCDGAKRDVKICVLEAAAAAAEAERLAAEAAAAETAEAEL